MLKYSRFVPNSGQGWKSSWKQYSYKTDIQFEFVRNLHGSTFYPDPACGYKLCAVMTAIPWKTSIKKWKYLCWEFFRVIYIVLENVKRFWNVHAGLLFCSLNLVFPFSCRLTLLVCLTFLLLSQEQRQTKRLGRGTISQEPLTTPLREHFSPRCHKWQSPNERSQIRSW